MKALTKPELDYLQNLMASLKQAEFEYTVFRDFYTLKWEEMAKKYGVDKNSTLTAQGVYVEPEKKPKSPSQ